jgi:hypothetical protein
MRGGVGADHFRVGRSSSNALLSGRPTHAASMMLTARRLTKCPTSVHVLTPLFVLAGPIAYYSKILHTIDAPGP